ncbi:MAG: hypothetical protein WC599_00725 [Bacteroidales bacterium]
MPLASPEIVIHETKRLVESDKRSEIRLNANGGNSILIVCEPAMELEYVQAIEKFMSPESYEIIDLNSLLNDFIESNKTELEGRFDLLKGSIQQVFKTPEGEEGVDLFGQIIQAISKSYENKKIPVIIHSGALYGSKIENIHIMENPLILNGPLPLIILYPATKDDDKLMFLGKRPASKYRCMIID